MWTNKLIFQNALKNLGTSENSIVNSTKKLDIEFNITTQCLLKRYFETYFSRYFNVKPEVRVSVFLGYYIIYIDDVLYELPIHITSFMDKLNKGQIKKSKIFSDKKFMGFYKLV